MARRAAISARQNRTHQLAARETENQLVVRPRMRFDRNKHCSFGRSRVNDCETFGIEPIEGAEANDGIERPELGEFRQSIVIQLDKFSIRRGGEPRPSGDAALGRWCARSAGRRDAAVARR